MPKEPCVYILANKPHGVLYIGVTADLPGRLYLHKKRITRGFTSKYSVYRLVYYEVYGDMYSAITRDKQKKGGSRAKKLALIESMNPDRLDLGDTFHCM